MTSFAIIGAGSVGRALGAGLTRTGHAVTFAVRDPDDLRHADLAARAPIAAAVAGAETVVLAIPAGAVVDTLRTLTLVEGQTIIDATNAVRMPVPEGAATMGDLVTSLVPTGVAVVKGFNTIGAEHMVDGTVAGSPAFLPIAGDRPAVDGVAEVAAAIGFAPVVLGGREAFGLVEQHAQLWIHLAFAVGWGRSFGFVVAGETPRDGGAR